MTFAKKPQNEEKRLEILRSYSVLDTLPEKEYDDIVFLASHICGVPISAISLVDESRQWFKSKVGLEAHETSRDIAFCAHAILNPTQPFIVSNASHDERFKNNPLVTGYPGLQFYAGTPLVTSDGYALGTLCVIDKVPRNLSDKQVEALQALGRQVIAQLELRKSHELEKMVARHHERYRLVVDNLVETIFQVDPDGYFTFLSPNWEQMMGYSLEKTLGTQFVDYIHPEDRNQKRDLYRKNLQSKSNYCNEQFRFVKNDGTVIWVDIISRINYSQNGETLGVTGSLSDITHSKKLEKELEAQRTKLISSAKMSALGEMASGVAHEINNPLAIIRGHVQLLKRSTKSGPLLTPQVVDCCKKIEDTVVRISKIINGLRAFARDGAKDPFEDIKIQKLIEETLALCNARFRKHDISVTVEIENPEATIFCQPIQISQVLLNLLNNSFDAILNEPKRWIHIKATEVNSNTLLAITDCGAGIPEQLKDQIMLPFFSTKPVGKGTGLGLSISKGIIESHNGSLMLDTSCKNTQFKILIPGRGTAASKKDAA